MTSATAPQQNIIEFQQVSKSFGDLKVLDQLSLAVKPGEKLALIGPSGSGKTTILRILMTLEAIDDGHVVVSGEQLWHEASEAGLQPASEKHLRRMRNHIGMVFQHFNLFPHLTAQENVVQPQILIKGRTKPEAQERAGSLFQMIGLEDKRAHYPHELSGGQQQRVAIARALAMDPKIMLFDEVTSALDPELVEEVLAVLRDLAASSDTTLLTVTHEMSFAKDFADRVLFFDGGRVVESGPPKEILTRPKEERTKEFLKKFISNLN